MTVATIHKIKTVDESRFNEAAGFQADAELELTLEAGASYWIEACIVTHGYSDYASRISARLSYSGVLQDSLHHLVSHKNYHYFTSSYQANLGDTYFSLSQAGMVSALVIDNSNSDNAAFRGFAWWSGRITCTTGGVLYVDWTHLDNGGAGSSRPSTVFAGSWIYATPLDICPL